VAVVASGPENARGVAAAMRDTDDVHRVPAQLVRSSERVAWFIDRAGAADLLRDAHPA